MTEPRPPGPKARPDLQIGQDNGYALDLYGRYRRDPASVPVDWRLWFEGLDGADSAPGAGDLGERLLAAFRQDGHRAATLDPLAQAAPAMPPHLAALVAEARQAPGRIRWSLGGAAGDGPAAELADRLARVYAGPAALEAEQVEDTAARAWLTARYEAAMLAPPTPAALLRAHRAIGRADVFEDVVRLKYPTKKRFGSEGSEGALLLLQEMLRHAARAGVGDVVMGGMHRGRLATLATVLDKDLATLMAEIKGRDLTQGGPDYTGDVPYHLGHVAETAIDGHPIRLSIAPHPSHLIVVAPVATGLARARRSAAQGKAPLCLLLHTDAALAGQGLAAELAQLSRLDGYDVGGTIHLVVNNQIGFTTLPSEGRSARYCTDVAKLVGAPVLHVNGDDPAALLAVAGVAVDWRMRFGRDVYIDLVCYRRNGHNELDEPRFTQPATWDAIDRLPPLAAQAAALARQADAAGAAAVTRELEDFRAQMTAAHARADTLAPNADDPFQPGWAGLVRPTEAGLLQPVETGLDLALLRDLGVAGCAIDPAITPHPKLRQFYDARRATIATGEGISFATAEALAFGSLLAAGHSVRLTGQDSARGTFTQRHLRVTDLSQRAHCVPLAATARNGARFEVHNSPLSEYAVLGFDYGHSLHDPATLTLWEAQFGDFLNGAQIVVDQYITSAEAKWGLRTGLVVLLPHGLEGQGPDHSSARPERLLQACANGNMILANPTTPANYFHLLRRQILAPWRKPLFVMAPKSLLRARVAVSALADFGPGTGVRTLIADGPARPGRVVLCSGKIAHDLAALREAEGLADHVAILRVEQLYPLDLAALVRRIDGWGDAALVWCQEEPRNQGAYGHVRTALADHRPDLAARLAYAGRPALPVAAGGSIDRHQAEQDALLRAALAP